jgi:transcriptional regulator with XRE-family HTH domain
MWRKVTASRRHVIGEAVKELRRRTGWNQTELAAIVRRYAGHDHAVARQSTVVRWEQQQQAPSLKYRIALAKIAHRRRFNDLERVFRMLPGD